MVRPSAAWRGEAGLDRLVLVRSGMAREARRGRLGPYWCGSARRVEAWRGAMWQGVAGKEPNDLRS